MVLSGRSSLGSAGRSIASPRGGGVVLTRADLMRLKESAVIITPEVQRARQEKLEQDKQVKLKKSRDRKQYMTQKAEEAKRKAPPSDVVLLQRAETAARLKAARQQKEEQLDGAKHLNTLGARAAAFTIRQQQLKEKEEREEKEKLYDQRMNILMEKDRLISLRDAAVEEAKKKQQRIADRVILQKQISDREAEQRARQRQIDLEAAEIAAQMKKAEDDELNKMAEKQHHHKQIQIELAMSNAKALAIKQAQARREQDEDNRILEYQRAVARKEEEDERMKKERAQAETLRIAKISREMQKGSDAKAVLDELRAKRAAEAKERLAREKDQEDIEKQQEQLRVMHLARRHQKQTADMNKAIAFKEQQEEYRKNLERAADIRAKDLAYEAQKHEERLQNRKVVQAQIREKEIRRRQHHENVRNEGELIKNEYGTELNDLERIREEKIAQLRDQGVDETYLTEMQRADMRKLQMR